MKRFAAAIAAMGLLAGCGAQTAGQVRAAADPTTAPPAVVTVTAPPTVITVAPASPHRVPPSTQAGSVDYGYLHALRQSAPDLRAATDAQLIRVGRLTCRALDAGVPLGVLLSPGQSSLGQLDDQSIVVSAIQNFCPAYEGQLDDWKGAGS